MKNKANTNKQADSIMSEPTKTWPIIITALILIVLGLIAFKSNDSILQQIQKDGELRIITRNSSTSYYENLDGKAGFEYDLASAFAKHLGVELKILIADNFDDILPMMNGGQGHIAAAGLHLTEQMLAVAKPGPGYQNIHQQIIYKRITGVKRIRKPEDLIGKKIIVASNSAHIDALEALKRSYPDISWNIDINIDNDQLLNLVDTGEYDAAVINSNEFQHYRRLFTQLRIAFNLGEETSLNWAFPLGEDNSLLSEAELFFENYKKEGLLTQLIERHYGHTDKYSSVEMTVFLRHVNNRLQLFKSTFQKAGELYDLDWRLLAAIAYQESHWETDATSPTGVRGIMMLTLRTAAELNVANRLDSTESILGGARYFNKMLDKIPADIQEPDRTWMALASYNVGYGHLEDARKITEKTKGNPDTWIDVRERLPLLSQKKWYTQTRHGYARGREPVKYVQNIREYYDTLQWLDDRETSEEETEVSNIRNKKVDVVIPKIL